jgi:hypothetical protein
MRLHGSVKLTHSLTHSLNRDVKVINECLDQLIQLAMNTREEGDAEAMQNRDYANVKDPSLLRFLVDMRGVDATSKQVWGGGVIWELCCADPLQAWGGSLES